jgi:PhzF family phenazine biosynthesis protein
MMRGGLHRIHTFTDCLLGGNPAYVVTLPDWPGEARLTATAAELNLSVVAFLVPSDERFAMRFYSAKGAHGGAGHATLAAAWVAFRDRTGAAITLQHGDAAALRAEREGEWISVTYPATVMERRQPSDQLERVLGRRPSEVWFAPFGLVAVLEDQESIAALDPEMSLVEKLDGSTLIVTAPGREVDFVSRVFAPKQDLPEDPVCGTAHRQLFPYWSARLGRRELLARQMSRRGGLLRCSRRADGVAIAGACVPFIEGMIDIAG